ncbi:MULTISPECIES: hypothetical protein [Shewanella]|jgi:hypothetical protein|uniref:Primosomal replication protein PriB/PriC domain protein n=1 Tax=Shewanella frigidimarina (strain NCIMB 400) TaxID=318167 RepID=Q083N8_SHEFN|nr:MULTISPECIES: hypothetical protein [Shewanella]ABI71527.1 conserved hypothetical protein [Shewanella frigidimarina NCIMB 400]MBB1320603.1 hypothetical protein [Shewanella sp. SR43-8]QHS13195.1 hypothetical protein GUY17_08760 [Shewanella sp. Arc9-LZ]RPA32599.1 hypothetical protein EGC78_08220 [Shewanella frigidimarina]|tara:strand:+ start:8673 stop:8876 length:204 start_codon:yes stop_codon:yes gene_type:complete
MSKQEAADMVALYIEAEKDVLAGKSVSINGKMMSTEDLEQIRKGRMEWQRTLSMYTRPRGTTLARFN